MAGLLEAGGARWPWAVLILAAALATSAFLADALTTQANFTSRPESVRARDLVEQRLRGPERDTELVIVRSASRTVDDPAFRARVAELQAGIAGLGRGAKRKAEGHLVEGQITTSWKQALAQLALVYPDRINPHL